MRGLVRVVGTSWILVLASLVSVGCGPALLETHPDPLPRGIQVTGTGEASAKPDVARVNVGVEVRDRSASAAVREANRRVEQVLARLGELGLADEDLQTTQFSIHFERDEPAPHPPRPVREAPSEPVNREEGRDAPAVGGGEPGSSEQEKQEATGAPRVAQQEPTPLPEGYYRVSNSLEVTVRDFAKLGKVLSATTEAGANHIWGIRFEIDDTEPLIAEAREAAMRDARRQAQNLARLAGVELGKVVSVQESGDEPVSGRMYRMAESAAADAVPVRGGELDVTRRVQLRYAIE